MKYLIKVLVIIGLVSISHVAIAIDNVDDGDLLTAEGMNEVIDAVNSLEADFGLGFDITAPQCLGNPVYEVGDTGPSGAGGLVFFVTADGCNGLEAAPDDQGVSDVWGCFDEAVIGADGMDIGDGARNTLDVVLQACTDPEVAVDLTRAYTGGTAETDWYLPSKDELLEMYSTIGPGGTNAGNFDAARPYWSSTEIDAQHVVIVNFVHGAAISNPKNFRRNTRAIRTILDP